MPESIPTLSPPERNLWLVVGPLLAVAAFVGAVVYAKGTLFPDDTPGDMQGMIVIFTITVLAVGGITWLIGAICLYLGLKHKDRPNLARAGIISLAAALLLFGSNAWETWKAREVRAQEATYQAYSDDELRYMARQQQDKIAKNVLEARWRRRMLDERSAPPETPEAMPGEDGGVSGHT